LEATSLVSRAGAQFKSLDDGSYLAEGKNGEQDDYTFIAAPAVVSTNALLMSGLRLDALADPSLKKNGPGRADNGNIGLSRLRIFVVAGAGGGGGTQEVHIAKAVADFEQNHEQLSIAAALDDNPKSGWAVDPQFGKDHRAAFT